MLNKNKTTVAVSGPTHGGWPAWLFTSLLLRWHGAVPVRLTPDRNWQKESFDAIIIGGGSDIDQKLYKNNDEVESADSTLIDAINEPSLSITDAVLAKLIGFLRNCLSLSSSRGKLDPNRDQMESQLIQSALKKGLPILGICRGMQLINVVLGGGLYQSLNSFYVESPQIRSVLPKKLINIEEDSLLSKILERNTAMVNALHDQAVDRLGDSIKVVAKEPNGVTQAIESVRHPNVLGVQWHPEYLPQKRTQRLLFNWIVKAARRAKQAE